VCVCVCVCVFEFVKVFSGLGQLSGIAHHSLHGQLARAGAPSNPPVRHGECVCVCVSVCVSVSVCVCTISLCEGTCCVVSGP